MPKFMDYHDKAPNLPPEVIEQLKAQIEAGQADEHGVKPLNAFFGTDGQGHCLTEAPSVEAVIKSHEGVGATQTADNIIEV